MTTIVPSTAKFTWTDATKNLDGSAITSGEVTGFLIGIRPSTGTAGTYPINSPAISATAVSEAVAAISTSLVAGDYAASIMSVGPANSAWSPEVTFTIALPVPQPPSSFTLA